MNTKPIDWAQIGQEVRTSAEDVFGAEDIPSVNLAYDFLLDNPECFGFDEWPEDFPIAPNSEFIAAYYRLASWNCI